MEQEDETREICAEKLKRHLDDLGEDAVCFSFSDLEGPITIITDPNEDQTFYVNHHPLSSLGLSYPVKTIYMSSLTELDRLGPDVDLVSYQAGARGGTATAAFKYWWLQNGMFRTWYELNYWVQLPRHPHIVPFDAVVLDDVRGGIVGFTTRFVPGSTLKDTARTRTIRLKWLRQLLEVVDTLNYEYGLMHQDIATWNIVIDPQTDSLQIFDFSRTFTMPHSNDPRLDDVEGVVHTLYDIITLSEKIHRHRDYGQDHEDIMKKEWTKHPDVSLDSSVQAFKNVLGEWMAGRKNKPFTPRSTWIEWKDMSEHPVVPRLVRKAGKETTEVRMESSPVITRRHYIEMSEPFYEWRRPASYKLRQVLERDQGEPSSAEPEENRMRLV